MAEPKIRLIPEWEEGEILLLSLPDASTDWEATLDDALQCYKHILKSFSEGGEKVLLLCSNKEEAELKIGPFPKGCRAIEIAFNDTWTRDYGPITVDKEGRRRALDFGFNGWGLKFAADYDNLVNLRMHERGILMPYTYRNERDFVLEGGSIETDGTGTLLTTSRCLCSPNRNGGKTKAEIAEILNHRLGIDHVLWLDYGALAGDDTDSHIDTLARLCPHNTILFTGCRDENDEHFEELIKMRAQLTLFRTAEGDPYNLIELPLPDAIFDENGERLPATYANYLVTPRRVYIPSYNQPQKDELARRILGIVFGDREVVSIDCRALIRQHGSLHCATMQLPSGIVNPSIYE